MYYRVLQGLVESFCRHYRGPKFHAILCDPPYEIKFLGHRWDASGVSFRPETWAALAALLYPGGFMFSYGGTRTYHRMATAIEDGGFIIHPAMGWLYGTGMPKGTRIDTKIDVAAGESREDKIAGGHVGYGFGDDCNATAYEYRRYVPHVVSGAKKHANNRAISPLARAWEDYRYGQQALKPAFEFIGLAQRPYKGRPIDCITGTGAGALNINSGRVVFSGEADQAVSEKKNRHTEYARPDSNRDSYSGSVPPRQDYNGGAGRWPPNLAMSHLPGCRRVGQGEIRPQEGYRPNPVAQEANGQIEFNRKPAGYQKLSYTTEDGTELVEVWECEPGCPVALVNSQGGGDRQSSGGRSGHDGAYNGGWEADSYYGGETPGLGDAGPVGRYFPQFDWSYEIAERTMGVDPFMYVPKPSVTEKDAGLIGHVPCRQCGGVYSRFHMLNEDRVYQDNEFGHGNVPTIAAVKEMWRQYKRNRSAGAPKWRLIACRRCHHPTVKPIALNQWLAGILLPPPGYGPRRILVPFSGAGSEMIGAMLAGWDEIIGIELDGSFCQLSRQRIDYYRDKHTVRQLPLL